MRRPNPLPIPVGSAGRSRPVEPDAPSVDELAEAAASLAPVIPLSHDPASGSGWDADPGLAPTTAPDPVRSTDSEHDSTLRPEPGSPSEPGSTPDSGPEIGLREVWRAARASRKALRAEVRRFTGRQRRRRLTWIVTLGALALLIVGTVAAAYSPLFGVERVRVVGAEQLDPSAVEAALASQVGKPLPLVDESAVKAALVAFPLVETYALEARPPHELVVRIVERTPIGIVQTPAGYTLVDAAGVALSTTQGRVDGQPLLSVDSGTSSPAFAALGQVMRSLPDEIRTQVTAASATTRDDVTLTLGGTRTQVVWGSAENSAMKALRLQTIMAARPPAEVSVYDVSSPSAIVVR